MEAITNGSEHMFKRALEMHIGSILPISSPLKMIDQIHINLLVPSFPIINIGNPGNQ